MKSRVGKDDEAVMQVTKNPQPYPMCQPYHPSVCRLLPNEVALLTVQSDIVKSDQLHIR